MACAKYYWPTMHLDIEKHIAQCLSCAETKGTTTTAPILEYPLPAGPFEVVGIDLLQLPCSIQGSIYVCVDHFSRFTTLAPLPNKSATTVAYAIVSHLICPYTTPCVFLSDNGIEFKNQVLQDIYLHHITLLLMASLNMPTGKSLRFCATLQDTFYRKLGRIGFLTLLPLLTALSIPPQAKRLTTSFMDLRNAYLTMCLCPLLFPCTPQMIILNCSFTASRLSRTLFGRNLKLHGRKCYANSTLRLPHFILMPVTLS